MKLLFSLSFTLLISACYAQLSTVTEAGRMISTKIPAASTKSGPDKKEAVSLVAAPITKTIVQQDKRKLYFPLYSMQPTSHFGNRYHPVLRKQMFHAGIDLKAKDEPVYAFAAGIVVQATYDSRSGFCVVIDHGGDVKSVYAHLRYIGISKGADVRAGSLIALSGNTGMSTAPHLHFALKYKNAPVNPEQVFQLML